MLGGGGGASGAKFVVSFSIEGSGEADLEKIAKLSKMVAASFGTGGHGVAGSMGHGAEAARGLSSELGEMSEKAMSFAENIGVGVLAISETLDKVHEFGLGMMEAGVSVLHGWTGLMEKLMEKGGEFENMLLRIQGAGNTPEKAQEILQATLAATARMPITEAQATRIATALAQHHVDVTQSVGKGFDELIRTGKVVGSIVKDAAQVEAMRKQGHEQAIDLIGDLMAQQGQTGPMDADRFIREFSEYMMTGQTRFIRNRINPELVQQLHAAGTNTKRQLDTIYKYLEDKHAIGMARAASMTYSGVMSNFRGLFDRISIAIMDPGKEGGLQTRMAHALAGLYQIFNDALQQGSPVLEAFKGAIGEVVRLSEMAIKGLGMVTKWVLDFAAHHPTVLKMAAVVSVLTGVVLVMTGALIAAGAAAASFAFFVGIAMVAMLPLLPFLGSIAAAMGVLLAVFAEGAIGLGSWAEKFESIKLVVVAVSEALNDWHGAWTSISEDTAKQLEEKGLLGVFLKVIHYIAVAQQMWEGFSAEFSSRWHEIAEDLGRTFEHLFGSNPFEAFNMSLSDGRDKGRVFADTIIEALKKIDEIVDRVATLFHTWFSGSGDMEARLDGWVTRFDRMASIIDHILWAIDKVSFVMKDRIPQTSVYNPNDPTTPNVTQKVVQWFKGLDLGPAPTESGGSASTRELPAFPSSGAPQIVPGGSGPAAGTGGSATSGGADTKRTEIHMQGDVHLDGEHLGSVVWKVIKEKAEQAGHVFSLGGT